MVPSRTPEGAEQPHVRAGQHSREREELGHGGERARHAEEATAGALPESGAGMVVIAVKEIILASCKVMQGQHGRTFMVLIKHRVKTSYSGFG